MSHCSRIHCTVRWMDINQIHRIFLHVTHYKEPKSTFMSFIIYKTWDEASTHLILLVPAALRTMLMAAILLWRTARSRCRVWSATTLSRIRWCPVSLKWPDSTFRASFKTQVQQNEASTHQNRSWSVLADWTISVLAPPLPKGKATTLRGLWISMMFYES